MGAMVAEIRDAMIELIILNISVPPSPEQFVQVAPSSWELPYYWSGEPIDARTDGVGFIYLYSLMSHQR